MGHVLQAGQGQITARQAAIAAGIPKEVPAITVNKVCLSGMSAIAMADQMIRAGEVEVVVAGGMESMTNAPYLLPKAREGARLGDTPMVDSMIRDGLWCAFDDRHMGAGTDAVNAELGVSARTQDAWAARSHARAARRMGRRAARRGGRAGRGAAAQGRRRSRSTRDEGIRPDTDAEALRRPAAGVHRRRHRDGGQRVADQRRRRRGRGRRARRRAERLGLAPLAEIVAYGMSRGPVRVAAHRAGARDGEGR